MLIEMRSKKAQCRLPFLTGPEPMPEVRGHLHATIAIESTTYAERSGVYCSGPYKAPAEVRVEAHGLSRPIQGNAGVRTCRRPAYIAAAEPV